MPSYGLLMNPSNEIINFEYAEIGIEGPEGNPEIMNKKKDEIVKLLQRFKQKPIGHTAYWVDLASDYDYKFLLRIVMIPNPLQINLGLCGWSKHCKNLY